MSLSRALALKCGLVFAGCALAASIVIKTDEEAPGGIAQPVARAKKSDTTRDKAAGTVAALDVSRLNRSPVTELEENLFIVPRPPAPPPPPPAPVVKAPPVVVEPPPKPIAPALPFRFLGTLVDGGTTTLFIAQGAHNYSVKPGQAVNDTYRLEQLSDAEAIFLYVPLNERQTLAIGSRK